MSTLQNPDCTTTMTTDNPHIPSEAQQKKIIERLDEIDEEFRGSPTKRQRRKHALLHELAIDPSEIDDDEMLDELRHHVNIVKWTDTESDERVKARPKDIRELHESGLSKDELKLLGYDPSVL